MTTVTMLLLLTREAYCCSAMRGVLQSTFRCEENGERRQSVTREDAEDVAQSLLDAFKLGRRHGGRGWERKHILRALGFGFELQSLARTGNRETLFIKQVLDAQHVFDIALTVHALSGAALHRLQL